MSTSEMRPFLSRSQVSEVVFILNAHSSQNLPEKLRNVKVRELMEDSFPVVSVKTSIMSVIPLLQDYQAVITSEKGRPVGIVTNADISPPYR